MGKIIEALHTTIDKAIIDGNNSSRDYMGVSGIGVECDRQLWYSFHTPKPVDSPKALVTFKIGHALEVVAIDILRSSGLTVWNDDGSGQFGFKDGVVEGHIDGVIKGIPGDEDTPYLLEIKTANDFRFKDFVKHGFCSDEKYKTQIHIYMYKMNLKKCLAFVLNKNTSDRYYEIIELDEFFAVVQLQRGHTIAELTEPPERKYPSKSWFKCQYCNWKKECWG